MLLKIVASHAAASALPTLIKIPDRNAQVLRFGPPGAPASADAGCAIASTPAINPATMNAPVNFRMTHFLCVVEYRTARPSRLPGGRVTVGDAAWLTNELSCRRCHALTAGR